MYVLQAIRNIVDSDLAVSGQICLLQLPTDDDADDVDNDDDHQLVPLIHFKNREYVERHRRSDSFFQNIDLLT